MRIENHPHTPESLDEEAKLMRNHARIAKRNELLFVANSALSGLLAGRRSSDGRNTIEYLDDAFSLARCAIQRADEAYPEET